MTDPRIEAALQAAWEYTWESESGCPLGIFRKRKPDVVKNLEGALAAAIAAADAEAWRPIESAPRDGSRFFAWFPLRYQAFSIRWVFNIYDEKEDWTLDDDESACRTHDKPTHWQPLPAPPTGGGNG